MSDGILFCGDPHGRFGQIRRAVEAARPAAVVLLGDMDLPAPLDEVMAPVTRLGAEVWWIHGNHDTDRIEWHDRLFHSGLSGRNLSGRVVEIAGLRVAGLGGIFRSKVWHPHDGDGAPKVGSRNEYMAAFRHEGWREGLPIRHRSTIFPEDLEALADLQADVLVSHEAPSSHRHGFAELDILAEAMRTKVIVHGHHHVGYEAELPNGIAAFGVDKHGVLHSERLSAALEDSLVPAL